MTLSERVKKAAEMDWLVFYTGDDAYDGVRAERARLQPLIEALALCVENLQGQTNPTSEALWKLRNVLEEMEKQ